MNSNQFQSKISQQINMSQSITISQLTPNYKGDSLLRFQVIEIGTPLAQPHQINCKIVDQTGCINAYFNNYAKFIKQGGVYQLASFKCKVVDHSLRVQLRKDSKITRIKHQIGFKDLFNNLSEKFYVSKTQQKLSEPIKVEQGSAKNQEAKGINSKNQKEIPKEQKVNNKQSPDEKPLKNAVKDSKKDESERFISQGNKNVSKQNQKAIKSEQRNVETTKKKIYIQKNPQQSPAVNEEKRMPSQQQRTLLKDIYKFRQKNVNLKVKIITSTIIEHQKYYVVKVCDSSGSVYIQLQSRMVAEDKSWYHLKNFTVFKDKFYGYIASQNKYSDWQILYDFEEKPDFRPIDFKNK